MTESGRYPIPAARHRAELVVERSRFVATLAHAATTADAHALIAAVRAEWPGATHHCTAWVAGPPGSTARVGMSDDGEPHGTAGRPMLQVLLHAPVGEIVAVVTRWYGGTKLGTGGLTRAYAGAVELALRELPTTERITWATLGLAMGYGHVDAVRRLLPEFEAEVLAEAYGASVRYDLRVPEPALAGFLAAVRDATRGEAGVDMTE